MMEIITKITSGLSMMESLSYYILDVSIGGFDCQTKHNTPLSAEHQLHGILSPTTTQLPMS